MSTITYNENIGVQAAITRLDYEITRDSIRARIKNMNNLVAAIKHLNEREAEIHADYLGQFWQYMFPEYGTRHNASPDQRY